MRQTGFLWLLLGTRLLLSTLTVHAQTRTYDIRSFGAKADGKTLNTKAIQKAIDRASAQNGGTVLVPEGRFVTGVLTLRSGVTLSLADGAVLLGSTNRLDYGTGHAQPLIHAEGQNNIALTGHGTIDGQGDALLKDLYDKLKAGTMQDAEWQTPNPWHQVRPSEENRPKIIQFTHCTGVTVKGITLKHALDWVEDYKSCSDVTIDSIRVESNTFWNNDGIDLVDCKNVRLTHSFFDADDDGICLKSEDRNDSCDNIVVTHCTVRSSASAIKFGTAGRGGFHHITISDIHIYDTYRSAIALECVDGGRMDDIDIHDIHATNTGNALFIRLGHRNKDSVYSTVRRLRIAHVEVAVPAGKPDAGYPMEGPPLRFEHNIFPASIVGLPGHPVEDVVLEDIKVTYPGGGVALSKMGLIPENPSEYPEFSMFGELPAWGLYIRHATGITLKNVVLTAAAPDYRPTTVYEDVTGIAQSGTDF
jgi:polygalacturonase